MNELQGHLSRKETLVAAISKDPEIRERLISECLSDGWDLKTAKRAVSKFAPHIPEFVETNMEAFRSMVNEQFALVRPVTPRATRDAHLAALAKDPGANRRADVYAALHWFVVRTEKPLWLADSVCIFETRGHRRFKPMNDGDDELVRVYLPFSKAQVLVGSGHGGCPSIDVGVLNKAAVRCSYEFFVSSFHPGSEQIPTAIGAWSGIFSPRELERFIQQTKREWPSRRR
jgi:hypothetical protein